MHIFSNNILPLLIRPRSDGGHRFGPNWIGFTATVEEKIPNNCKGNEVYLYWKGDSGIRTWEWGIKYSFFLKIGSSNYPKKIFLIIEVKLLCSLLSIVWQFYFKRILRKFPFNIECKNKNMEIIFLIYYKFSLPFLKKFIKYIFKNFL